MSRARLLALFLALALAPALAACAGVRAEVADHAAAAADASLESTEWALCQAASVGAVHRLYGPHPAKFAAWKRFCGYGTE
jgi:ABC-type enterobactin transport system permease subunit